MIKKCLTCSNNFITRPARVKVGKGKYCTKQCYWVSKRGKPTWNKGMATFDARKYNQEWARTHRDWISQYVKRWKELNPEKKVAIYVNKQLWRKNNPEREKLYQEKRKANMLNAKVNDFTFIQWIELLLKYKNRCAYCEKFFSSLTQDHIIPLSRGGSHTKTNIVPACSRCNCRKNDLLLAEDAKSNFRLFKNYLNRSEVSI